VIGELVGCFVKGEEDGFSVVLAVVGIPVVLAEGRTDGITDGSSVAANVCELLSDSDWFKLWF